MLDDVLEKYASNGAVQFVMPDVLKVPPSSDRGNISEIIKAFGTANGLQVAVNQHLSLLYAA